MEVTLKLAHKSVRMEAVPLSNEDFPVCNMTPEEVRNAPVVKRERVVITTLEEYYEIQDVVSSLERLRAYQLWDIFGKYKLF